MAPASFPMSVNEQPRDALRFECGNEQV
jgi:hypothetical protein